MNQDIHWVLSIDRKNLPSGNGGSRNRDQDSDRELLDAYSRAVTNVVETVDDLHRLLSKWPPGTTLTVKLLRSGRVENYRVTPREG